MNSISRFRVLGQGMVMENDLSPLLRLTFNSLLIRIIFCIFLTIFYLFLYKINCYSDILSVFLKVIKDFQGRVEDKTNVSRI